MNALNIIMMHPVLVTVLLVWSLIWKGIALWKSARRGEKAWFIIFIIANTVGILEILYIYIFSKMEKNESSE